MKKLVLSSALALFVFAPVAGAATAQAQEPVADSGSSSLDVLCGPLGGILVLAGSAENPYGPLLGSVCFNR
ncbi:hypothetical protein ACFC06_22110 [Nocardia sp. NPDC056064]|uniref:hypothetical protein n=1 Tax=Nocardia sp. NPDC056064 TaxID=3345701 RepID=UPI0035DF28C8